MVAVSIITRDPVGPPATARAVTPVRIAVASEGERTVWDRYVDSCDAATGYHVWGWRTVFERAFGHEPVYLMAYRGGVACGVLPMVLIDSFLFGRTLTSLPCLNYGGVAADDDTVAEVLLGHAADIVLSRRCRHLELRHVARRFGSLPYKQHKVAMHLDLQDLAWDRLDKKVRNLIRKAQKTDFETAHGGAELLGDFYAVFARNMRDLGTPVYGREFFAEILRTFPDRTELHVVRLNGTAVAAAFTYRTRNMLEVPWASSVRDYNHLCPNYLLYWNLLQYARTEGCEVFDFGRSTPGEGTYRFKEQWGTRAVPLHWEYALAPGMEVPDVNPDNPKYSAAIELWKRLPVAVTCRIGPRIVRGIP